MKRDSSNPGRTRSTDRGLLIAALLATLAVASPASAKLSVVATTPDYGALAVAVGGDDVAVKVLAKATEDPHFVDAKPSHIVTLNRAKVLIESGADLELGWLPPLVKGARNAKVLPGGPGRVAGASGVKLLDVPTELDRSKGDQHARGNPHFLMDPDNAAIVATNLADVFCKQEPGSCEHFRGNLAAFQARLAERTRSWESKLEPFRGQAIVTYHNTWRYFAERFGLRAEVYLEPKPGIPPTAPHLAEVIDQMRDQRLKAILVEPFQSSKIASAVAERTGASVVEVCQFPGGLPGTDDDYLALMDANVDAIVNALTR